MNTARLRTYRTASVMAIGLSLVFSAPVNAEPTYQVDWISQFGTSSQEGPAFIAVDPAGNIYASGSTRGDLGGTNAGLYDTYLAKYDSAGNELWAKMIGSTEDDDPKSIAVDDSGNVYITGWTRGDLAGPYMGGNNDGYVTKLDPAGFVLWSKQIGTPEIDRSNAVAVDGAGNVYVQGYTSGDLFGTGSGINDAFLIKYDSSGNELWSHQARHGYNNMTVDTAGNVYVTGTESGPGSLDAQLIKYDTNGTLLWSEFYGSSDFDFAWAVDVDDLGNSYISGQTVGDLDGTNAGGNDAFLIKVDAAGNEVWSRQIGTVHDDHGRDVAVDALGNAYITGETFGGIGGSNAGESDAFLVKFDPAGTELWSLQVGSADHDESRSLALDGLGVVYMGGETKGDLSGPHLGGHYDSFLAKFVTPEPTSLALLSVAGAILIVRHR